MKKFLALTFAAMVIFTGCGNEKSTPPPQSVKQEKVETAEEKAEAERKAAEKAAAIEEKKRKEAELAAQRKAEQEAQRQQKQQEAQARLDDLLYNGVWFDYSFEKVGDEAYTVTGTTNLPEGMKIRLTVSNYYLVRRTYGIGDNDLDMSIPEHVEIQREVKARSFQQTRDYIVRDGSFKATFNTVERNQLKPGEYEFFIISLTPSLQNKDIQEKLGKKGEALFGMGVVESDSGIKNIQLEDIVYLP